MRRNVQENNKRGKVKNKKIESKFNNIKQKIRDIKSDKKKMNILVICILIIVGVIIANNYTSLGIVVNKNIDSKDTVQVAFQTSIEKVLPFGNQVLVYGKGTISIYNNYGKKIDTIMLDDAIDSDISAAGAYIQVLNKDKNVVYVYKNKYEVARIKLDGKIYSGTINSDGTSVIEYSSNGDKVMLGIYDNSGNIKYNIRPSNNIIGKYILSDNSKYLAYTDVDINGISIYTNVNLIDLSNIKESESSADKIYTFDNSLAYDMYWDGRNVITRFENSYIVYNTVAKKINNVKISESQVVNISDYANKFAYTELDIDGNYLLNIKNMESNKVKIVSLNDVPKYFQYDNGIVYVCYSKKIEAYNNFGMNIKNYTSDIVITEPIIFNNGRSLAMAVSNKLIMFTI